MNIKENTITIAVDKSGGMCDRLMLGEKGIINNACYSLECWKYNAPDDEDIQNMSYPTTLKNAIAILNTDNFYIEIVTTTDRIKELLQDEEIEINLNNIQFKEDNTYNIY